MNTMTKPLILQPGMGTDLPAFGNVLSIRLRGEQTGNMISIMLETMPPGGGPPLHVHSREDEIFIVAEGQISYYVNGKWAEVGPGGLIYLPYGSEHCYKNIGTSPSRHWIIALPSDFENFFTSCAEEFAKENTAQGDRIFQLHQEFGIELLDR